jgi:hypothetical protein
MLYPLSYRRRSARLAPWACASDADHLRGGGQHEWLGTEDRARVPLARETVERRRAANTAELGSTTSPGSHQRRNARGALVWWFPSHARLELGKTLALDPVPTYRKVPEAFTEAELEMVLAAARSTHQRAASALGFLLMPVCPPDPVADAHFGVDDSKNLMRSPRRACIAPVDLRPTGMAARPGGLAPRPCRFSALSPRRFPSTLISSATFNLG